MRPVGRSVSRNPSNKNDEGRGVRNGRTHGASPPAPGPPDLKHVGEIIIESERQKDTDPLGTEISYNKAMEQGGSPNEDRSCHVQQSF